MIRPKLMSDAFSRNMLLYAKSMRIYNYRGHVISIKREENKELHAYVDKGIDKVDLGVVFDVNDAILVGKEYIETLPETASYPQRYFQTR